MQLTLNHLSSRPGVANFPNTMTQLVLAALLAVVAYYPFLNIPYVSDDYVQIVLGRQFGPVSMWPALAVDTLYRSRATSILMTFWTEQLFGADPVVFRITSLILHILNVMLVAALGSWRVIGWRISMTAAVCFAIAERPQEAIVWYAALPELLVITFSLLSFLAWVRWLQGGAGWWCALSWLAFVVAIYSKESGVAVIGLCGLAAVINRQWKRLAGLLPYAAVAVVYTLLIFAAKNDHLHLNDGTFSLSAPFISTLLRSFSRMLWPWGFLAIGLLAWLRRAAGIRLIAVITLWIIITLLPYSFVGYMPRLPSRHMYWATVGLCLLLGASWVALRERLANRHKWVLALLAAGFLLHNVGYLWYSKLPQYEDRAAVTERFVEYAKDREGTIGLRCFPASVWLAKFSAVVRLGRTAESVLESSELGGREVDHWYCDPAADIATR